MSSEALAVLTACDGVWGECEIVTADPTVSRAEDVVAVPFQHGGAWGIFDRSGRVLDVAVDRHGPDGKPAERLFVAPSGALADVTPSDGETFIYGGFVNPHFGHFIANTLPRLWLAVRDGGLSHRILFHGPGLPAGWFALPFIRTIFGSIGIRPENVVYLDRPRHVRRLIVPHPAFQEQHFAHAIFGQLCRRIGEAVLSSSDDGRTYDRPIYLSKSGLTGGVGHFVNEGAVEEILAASGVEIVHPERLSQAAQIRLFNEPNRIIGALGSAYHNSVFCRPRARVAGLSPSSFVNSNFLMFDALCGLKPEYFFAPGTAVVTPENSSFITSLELPSPEEVAKDLLTLV